MPTPPPEFWIALRTDGRPGSGTAADPYDGSSPTLFDNHMETDIGENATIHLGPGIFQTRGYRLFESGWQPKNGQRIVGAGIDVTVLKLVDAAPPPPPYSSSKFFAIGAGNWLDSFEVRDLTIDCNQSGQPDQPGYDLPQIACGAVFVIGRHIRLRRLRVIHFGTHKGYLECFPINASYANPDYRENVDCVVEDCIIEKPAFNNGWITSCVILAGGERGTDGVAAYHRACAVRNCLFNCEYSDNPVGIAGITFSGMTATVTTKYPHNRSAGQWVVVTGALENGVPSTNYNGSFPIAAVLSATQFQLTLWSTPTAEPTGEMYIGKIPSRIVALDNSDPNDKAVQVAGSVPNFTITVKTVTPHNRVVGDHVVLNNVYVNGVPSLILNQLLLVTNVQSATRLICRLTSDTNPGDPDVSQPQGYIGPIFQAITADAGIGAIVEGNRVYNCESAYYHDTASTKDLVIRNNYFYGVTKGVNQSMGSISNPKSGSSLTHNGSVATFTTPLAHGFSVGQGVTIAGAKVQGGDPTQYPSLYYNGTFPIDSVPGPKQFTYKMTGDPQYDADSSPAPTFAAYWQVDRQIIEDNVMELVFEVILSLPFWGGFPSGVYFASSTPLPAVLPPYLFGQAVIRGNVIRNVDNGFDPSGRPEGITLNSCQNAIIENNIINLNCSAHQPPYNVAIANFGAAKCFNNQTPDGKLIQGYDGSRGQSLNELTTDAELTLLQSG